MKTKYLIIGLFLAVINTAFSQTYTTITISTDIDATISSYYPKTNFGNDETFLSYMYNGKYAERKRSLIKFDLSQIPAGSYIYSAKLKLFGINHTGKNESRLQPLVQSWDENTVTWNNQPKMSDFYKILPNSTTLDQDYEIEIKDYVQDWIDGIQENHGLMLHLSTVDLKEVNALIFASSDYIDSTMHPVLEITYEEEDVNEIVINSIYNKDTVIFPFGTQNIYGCRISGIATLDNNESLIRVILKTTDGIEYIVFEALPIYGRKGTFNIELEGEEAYFLENKIPYSLKIQITDASLNLNKITIVNNTPGNVVEKRKAYISKIINQRVENINEEIHARGMIWWADKTPLASLPYQKKKGYFAEEKYNTFGFEYYVSGFFQARELSTLKSSSMYPQSFDWRKRHGANIPGTPYYDATDGWVTDPAYQNGCMLGGVFVGLNEVNCNAAGGTYVEAPTCWAFGTVGAIETVTNLYFNQHIDVDLSQQEVATCVHTGNEATSGFYTAFALDYAVDNGISDESCFPYTAQDEDCSDVCSNPTEKIFITDWTPLPSIPGSSSISNNLDVEVIKENLIIHGPLVATHATWSHAMTLVGYDVVKEGDHISYDPSWTTGVPAGSPYIGRTYWIFKNSGLGSGWPYQTGFTYMFDPPRNYGTYNKTSYIGLPIVSQNLSNDDILCLDEDGDGYFNWGIGPKPNTCPLWAPDEEDCDDSDPTIGPYDNYYNCIMLCDPSFYSTIPVNITSNEIWYYDDYIYEDIVVNTGATLTIKCNLKIINQASIIVQKGAKLIIDGGKLTTTCENALWQGITVEGDETLPQYPYTNQGYIQLQNGAIIENAQTAILVESGAIVRASNSTFRNNRFDVVFEPYHSPNLPDYNYSYFTACDFKTEGQLNNINVYPVMHIKLDNVSGINIKNCSFTNDRTYALPGESGPLYAYARGYGIYAIDADFKVIPGCATIQQYGVPCPTPLRNTFEGLYYGIKASAINSSATAYISQCDFNNNYRGVLLENLNNPTIISNTFDADYIGEGTNLYLLYPPPYGNSTYAMYLNECKSYRVEENSFINGDAGLFIYNSGDQSHEIYKNEFENIANHDYASGISALGINSSITGNDGLEFLCNTFNTNHYNMSLIGNGSSIKQVQGSFIKATGNSLDHSCYDIYSDFYIDDNSLFSAYAYYHDGDPLVCTNMDFQGTASFNDCPSNLTTQPTLPVFEQRLAELKSNSETKKDELKALVDGGNTELMLSKVENITQQNYWQTCIEMLDASPYLSDTVLLSFMHNNLHRPVAKTLVLLANSPLPINVRPEIKNLNVGYWFKYFLNLHQNGTNPREEKEMEISSIVSERQDVLSKLVASTLYNDSVPELKDSVINILMNEEDCTAKYYLIPLLNEKGDFSEVDNQLNEFETEVYNMPDDIQNKMLDYIEYLRIVKVYKENNNDTNIIKNNIGFLQNIAEADNTPSSVGAQIMLESYSNNFDYPEKIEYAVASSQKSMAINNFDNNIYENKNFDDVIMVYPNPASNNLIVEYAVVDGYNNGAISIYDMQGKLILSVPITKQLDVKTIDVSGIPNGNYLITVGNKGDKAYSKKISIVH